MQNPNPLFCLLTQVHEDSCRLLPDVKNCFPPFCKSQTTKNIIDGLQNVKQCLKPEVRCRTRTDRRSCTWSTAVRVERVVLMQSTQGFTIKMEQQPPRWLTAQRDPNCILARYCINCLQQKAVESRRKENSDEHTLAGRKLNLKRLRLLTGLRVW